MEDGATRRVYVQAYTLLAKSSPCPMIPTLNPSVRADRTFTKNEACGSFNLVPDACSDEVLRSQSISDLKTLGFIGSKGKAFCYIRLKPR